MFTLYRRLSYRRGNWQLIRFVLTGPMKLEGLQRFSKPRPKIIGHFHNQINWYNAKDKQMTKFYNPFQWIERWVDESLRASKTKSRP